ncbi:hypothetical protein FLJC2902T_25030 [Flavobacterium limnosediminis JC2902]|uniref:Outer membrane protein beta-barrel domain-containing protein n=1 Tax=Flavobacterium limnosediminis JC2902 TaxID=1341181 RepID=V6SJR6_9FLAO|nr:porin family protein [Flavobacterium limnosediminis]ESU26532.1 hypothetical protein FLJC2902T_25030 [Flavobacterium limnosediminis JC2902]
MKKIFCLGLLLIGLFGFSQQREKGTIEVTPIIGYAASNYYASENQNGDFVYSVNFGVNGDYYFHNRWSLRSGLLLQTMGSEYIIPGDILNGPGLSSLHVEEKLTYMTIPVNANWHFGSTRKWNLNFGPSLGFLMSAKANSEDIKQYMNTFQLGLNYGIGYKIEVTEKIGILIDYQGMTGLTEVPKEGDVKLKNVYGTFNLGCVIQL